MFLLFLKLQLFLCLQWLPLKFRIHAFVYASLDSSHFWLHRIKCNDPLRSNSARFVNSEQEILPEIRTKRITVNFAHND